MPFSEGLDSVSDVAFVRLFDHDVEVVGRNFARRLELQAVGVPIELVDEPLERGMQQPHCLFELTDLQLESSAPNQRYSLDTTVR